MYIYFIYINFYSTTISNPIYYFVIYLNLVYFIKFYNNQVNFIIITIIIYYLDQPIYYNLIIKLVALMLLKDIYN